MALRSACRQDARLIELPENTGFSGANNTGIREALASGFAVIALINTDAEIEEGDFLRLLEAFDRFERLAAVGPLVVEPRDGGEISYEGGRDIAYWRQTRIQSQNAPNGSAQARYSEPSYVIGTVFVASAAAWREAGLLDESYFFSGEIADWCERARNCGYRLMVDGNAKAWHDTRMAGHKTRTGDYLYYSLRNRFLFVKKHRRAPMVALFAYWTAIALFEAAKSLVRGRFRQARACGSAVRDGLFGRYGARATGSAGSIP
jgi:GT2 family glycosyltransferase